MLVGDTMYDAVLGFAGIADKTSTVPTVVPSVNASLQPVRDFAEGI